MLVVDGISREFVRMGAAPVKALDCVSFAVPDRDAIGLVGESGSGKTTALRCVIGLDRPDSGTVRLDGRDVHTLRGAERRAYLRRVQLVSQDPGGSMNPRQTVEQIVGEGLVIHKLCSSRSERRDRVVRMLERVGLGAADLGRRIPSFSGGQQQRIAIARALAVEPELLVCDEPTSALDVSVQAQVLNLLKDLQAELGLSVLFVSHDLAVVRYVCSHIYVMHAGRIVEEGDIDRVFAAPEDAYTRDLLAAVPQI